MRAIPCLLALAALCGMLAAAEPPAARSSAERIELLVQQLGSSKFAQREKAQRELEAIGEPALLAVRRAVESVDQETSRRAGELAQKIESAVLATRLLAPKRVKLNFKDTPIAEALAELKRQSGYAIVLTGDRAALVNRKVTLATGNISFWEAFDRLCRVAGLVESGPTASMMAEARAGGRGRGVPFPRPVDTLAYVETAAGTARIAVHAGTPRTMPTAYAGAVRVRVLPAEAGQPHTDGETAVSLEITPEPRLEPFVFEGRVHLRKPADDQGQILALDMGLPDLARRILIRVKLGEKPARTLKFLEGDFTARVLTPPEPAIVVENILKAAGQTVKGKQGGSLQILAVQDLGTGEFQLRLRMTNVAQNLPGSVLPVGAAAFQQVQIGNKQVPIRVVGFNGRRRFITAGVYQGPLPSLVDAAGKEYPLVEVPERRVLLNNTDLMEEVTIVFRHRPGQGPPSRLILNGQHLANLPVAFRIENVPLP